MAGAGCLAMAAATGWAQAPVPPPPAWSPVLDCGARVYAIDTLICEDERLLVQSRRMEAAYQQALDASSGDNVARLTSDQRAWSRQRNMCAFKAKARACVERLQGDRAQQLARLAQGDTRR